MTRTVLLGDVVVFVNGGAWSQDKYKDSGVPVVRVTNIQDHTVKMIDLKYISSETAHEYRVNVLDTNDIVITTVGSHPSQQSSVVGRVARVPSTASGSLLNQNAVCVKAASPGVDQGWLYYFFRSPVAKVYIESHAKGSANQVRLAISSLKAMKLALPEIEKQRKIADILGTIDKKIELNRKMNETLEQMGQALFKKYFITIPETREKGKTTLGKIIHPKRGKSLTSKQMIDGDVPVVSGGLQPAGRHNEANTIAPVITASASGANAGYVALWGDSVWSADSSFIDTSVTDSVYFFYVLLKLNQDKIYGMQTGAAQPHIYPSHLEMLELPNIGVQQMSEFNTEVEPLFEKVFLNTKEIQTLTTLRDTLLPRLISGKVKI